MIPQDRLIKYATLFLELGIDNVEKLLEHTDFDKFNTAILEKQLEEYKHDLEEIRKGVRVMDLCTFGMFCIISGTLLGLYAIYRMERESRKDKERW